ncbi:hypothetical protein [Saccharopolyspora sp. ASAGF58]|uniref:hypothetical protein n=1 Tax=Saccharopolyspora sp. ASAGF58 TaxID=2719023 RepID=UPI00143FF89E|nr:hypothetical protein [Saccharopolyspora sp. ASAGF58]QIZ37604.1 hypothetical protein FDZ84_27260 [Saccharopolyspora sp. ASAGF58]
MNTLPQQVNVVPAAATLTVDLRAPEEAVLAKAESAIRHFAEDVALAYGCELTTCERMSRTAPATFDPAVVDRVADRVEARGLPGAQALVRRRARRAATRHDLPDRDGVRRSQRDGISHSPDEWSLPEDCTLGVQLMAKVAIGLLND